MYVKIAFALVICVGMIFAEICTNTDTTTCGHVLCSDGYTPTCVTNVCTCDPAPDRSTCATLSDCDGYWANDHCRHRDRHCIDGHCECRRL